MRRSVGTTVLCLAAACIASSGILLGCEDGPNQTFTPATGNLFNNGDTPGSNDPSTSDLDASYAGHSRTEICAADLKRARWAKMLQEDIVPPVQYAGLNMAGDDKWSGLTIEQAEQAPDPKTLQGGNCQPNPSPGQFPCPSGNGGVCSGVYWGDNGEVQFTYNLGTHIIDQMQLTLGYTGKLTATSRDQKHTYTMQIGLPLQRDNQPWLIPWGNSKCKGDPLNPCYKEMLTEFYNAVMVTFAPKYAGINFDNDDPNCKTSGTCLIIKDDGTGIAYFGVRPLALYLIMHQNQPDPIPSTPFLLYNFYVKVMPSSYNPQVLKLDNEGPTAEKTIGAVGDAGGGKDCNQKIGQTYKDFIDSCIKPFADQNLDQLNYNKLIGARTHDYENIFFNVVGVNQNFSLTPDLGQYGVVQDTDLPKDTDVSTDWFFDVRAYGHPINDFGLNPYDPQPQSAFGPGIYPDLYGSGLVMREWQRLVEIDLDRIAGQPTHAPGAPECWLRNPNDPTSTQLQTPAAGCTGMEMLVVPGNSYPTDTTILVDFPFPTGFNGPSLLKPGDPVSAFVTDWNGPADYQVAPVWDNALSWIVRVMGKGQMSGIPYAARDRRYFYKWYGVAMVKYLKAFGAEVAKGNDPKVTLTPDMVAAQPIDMETLFFDNNFGDQFDKFEYIDLASIVANPPAGKEYLKVPMDYEYGTDVKVANQRNTNFYRRLDREENALYTALLKTDKTLPPGSNANKGVNITNMFGSPVLRAAYANYKCATYAFAGGAPVGGSTAWKAAGCKAGSACNGSYCLPPLDANGNSVGDLNGQMAAIDPAGKYLPADGTGPHPLLNQYPAVWGRSIFSGPCTGPTCPGPEAGHSLVKINPGLSPSDIQKQLQIEGAQVEIPNFLDPWNACPMQIKDNTGAVICDPADTKYAAPALKTLVPWLPQAPGVGFEIPVNGSSDKFVTTSQIDFTGQLETYLVDFWPWTDPKKTSCVADKTCNPGFSCNGGQCTADDGSIRVLAIEAHDFLGEVFPCQDFTTGDILHVRMYTSTAEILQWFANHPGAQQNPSAQDSCDVVVRYSPYNNYPDFIASRANGVRMNTNQGQGFGRIVDATLFDPTLVGQ